MDIFFIVCFIVVIVLAVFIFGFVMLMMFSPKAKGKMLSNQMKSMKYMADESKDDIKSFSTDMANATKDSIEITTNAIKKGIVEDNVLYCKHCGSVIDSDFKFCKSCGKEQ